LNFFVKFRAQPGEKRRKRSFSEAEIKRSSFAARENPVAAAFAAPKRSFFAASAI
jgi:hypothetical protein